MAAVKVTIQGVIIIDGAAKPCIIIGDASLTGLEVGGGPIIPQPPLYPSFPIAGWPGSGFPDKPGYPPTAEHPIVLPPWAPPIGGKPPIPQFPIALPPDFVPPGPGYPDYIWGAPIIPPVQPPVELPPPGSVTLPPGNPDHIYNPIVVPKFMLVWYPGIGWVVVTPPAVATKK